MNVSDMVRAMKGAGCSPEQIVAAVELLDEGKREINNARQRRFRQRQAEAVTQNNVTSRYVTRNNVTRPPKKDPSPPTPPLLEKITSPFPSCADAHEPPKSENPAEIVDWFESQWNALAKAIGLGGIRAMTDKRMRAIRCRADDLVQALGFDDPRIGFTDTFNRIRGSPFLRGASNGARSWRCDVDWLLTESNFLKVHEGKYAQEPRSLGRR